MMVRHFSVQSTGNKGFTLIELAIIIAIAGVMLAAAATAALSIIETSRRLKTQETLNKIAELVDFYALRNNRLPCPANAADAPASANFGFEHGSAGGSVTPQNCTTDPARWDGVVPFRTLGLPEDLRYDGWGRLITYAISPAFSQNPQNENMNVHPLCRTGEWYYNNAGNQLVHKNPGKARFCCPAENVTPNGVNDDLNILYDDSDAYVLERKRTTPAAAPYDVTANAFPLTGDLNGGAMSVAISTNQPIQSTAPVYILVSHGTQGQGSYIPGRAARDNNCPATGKDGENCNNDRTFYQPVQRGDDFDDYVLWRTQDMIFALQGETCTTP